MFASCEHKELCYMHEHGEKLFVKFDWNKCSDANPDGMRTMFYNVNGDSPLVENLIGKYGGNVDVDKGQYKIIAFNNNTETILWRGENSISTLETYTKETHIVNDEVDKNIPRHDLTKEQPIAKEPEMFWHSLVVEHTYNTENDTIVIAMQNAIRRVQIDIGTIKNAQYITSMKATMSGVLGSLFISNNTADTKDITIPFDVHLSSDKTRVIGSHNYFGCCNSLSDIDPNKIHILTIYFWSSGGNVVKYFDVTKVIHDAPDPYNVYIKIDSEIDIPEGIGNGEGFNPDIGEWEDQNDDINI